MRIRPMAALMVLPLLLAAPAARGETEASPPQTDEVTAVQPQTPEEMAVEILADEAMAPEARRTELQRLANAHPDSAPIWTAYGEALEMVGDPRTAMMAYNRASAADPNLYTPWYRIGVLAKRGVPEPDYRRAEEAFRRALTAGAPRPQTLNELAVTLAISGRMKDAAALWREAVDADPDWGVLYTNLFKAALSLGDEATVASYLPGAINAGRFEVSAILRVGDHYVGRGKPRDAVTLYDRALIAHPRNAEILYYKAIALEEAKDQDGARAALQEARTTLRAGETSNFVLEQNIDFSLFRIDHPRDERRFQGFREQVFNRYEKADELQRQMTRAIRGLDPLIERHPTFWNGYFVRAKAHRMSNNPEAARDDLLKVLELVPNEPNATMELALVMRDEGDFEQAADLAEKAMELAPRDPLFAINGGFVLVEANRCAAAWDCYRRAVRMVGEENAAVLRDMLDVRCAGAN